MLLLALIALPVLAAAAGRRAPVRTAAPVAAAAGRGRSSGADRAGDLGRSSPSSLGGWLALDPPGRLVLLLVSVPVRDLLVLRGGLPAPPAGALQPRLLCRACWPSSGMMTLVVWSHHLGLMWVAIEATTLATAPLIYFNRTPRSIEATWKYLLVGSVGIALALLGIVLPGLSPRSGGDSSLLFEDLLLRAAPAVQALAARRVRPAAGRLRHQDGPGADAHLEARCLRRSARRRRRAARRRGDELRLPGPAARLPHLCRPRAKAPTPRGCWSSSWACFSMAVAGVFMVGQRDFKRMLAYSSVEHMGILVLGLGIGGPAIFGTLLHMINNGLTKGVLFLSAGNIHRAYGSKRTDEVRGAMRAAAPVGDALPARLPRDHRLAALRAVRQRVPDPERRVRGRSASWSRGGFLLLLLVVFIGMGRTVLAMVQGAPSPECRAHALSRRPAHRPAGGRLAGAGAAPRPVHPAAARGPAARRRRLSWRGSRELERTTELAPRDQRQRPGDRRAPPSRSSRRTSSSAADRGRRRRPGCASRRSSAWRRRTRTRWA